MGIEGFEIENEEELDMALLPPMTQRIMIGRQGEIEGKINRVKGLLDIC